MQHDRIPVVAESHLLEIFCLIAIIVFQVTLSLGVEILGMKSRLEPVHFVDHSPRVEHRKAPPKWSLRCISSKGGALTCVEICSHRY